MKVLLSWLRDFVDWSVSEQELAHKLTMAGFEVEAVERFSPGFEKVIVGRIDQIRPHPNADRLTLCRVSVGDDVLAIVCGAKNISEGDVVPVALDGAKLPGGHEIRAAKIRGEYSQGMMCSGKELGVDEDTRGIWHLSKDWPLGHDLAELLQMRDTAFVLNVTPNRSDALSVRGIAREIAAIMNQGVLQRRRRALIESDSSLMQAFRVEVDDFGGCPRYMARIVRDVKIGSSPWWLRHRLEKMGQRSINNVVDVTNWILWELGHPLHAFDLDKLEGARVTVRRAREGEILVTIDGEKRVLDPSMIVIADAVRPVAIAGVMGGKDTEVTETTRNILLECAVFSARDIRRTSKRLGLASESSYRFERGVDLFGLPEAVNEAAAMIGEVAGGQILNSAYDVYHTLPSQKMVRFRPDRCRDILGSPIEDGEIRAGLDRLGMSAQSSSPRDWMVLVPSYRPDLTAEIDLIEEVARICGYDRIEESPPRIRLQTGSIPFDAKVQARMTAKRILQGLGLDEAITYSFVSGDILDKMGLKSSAISLINPIRKDFSCLRTSLLANLIQCAALNAHRGFPHVRFFEIARCFFAPRREVEMLAIVLSGRGDALPWGGHRGSADFYFLKGIIEEFLKALQISGVAFNALKHPLLHPGRGSVLMIQGVETGFLGEAHPDIMREFGLTDRLYVAEINFELLSRGMDRRQGFADLPRYPSVVRDIAVLVDEKYSHAEIEKVIRANAPDILEEVRVFDVYQGHQIEPGKKSMAYSLRFRSAQGTLTDDEVDAEMSEIRSRLSGHLHCSFR